MSIARRGISAGSSAASETVDRSTKTAVGSGTTAADGENGPVVPGRGGGGITLGRVGTNWCDACEGGGAAPHPAPVVGFARNNRARGCTNNIMLITEGGKGN